MKLNEWLPLLAGVVGGMWVGNMVRQKGGDTGALVAAVGAGMYSDKQKGNWQRGLQGVALGIGVPALAKLGQQLLPQANGYVDEAGRVSDGYIDEAGRWHPWTPDSAARAGMKPLAEAGIGATPYRAPRNAYPAAEAGTLQELRALRDQFAELARQAEQAGRPAAGRLSFDDDDDDGDGMRLRLVI